MTRSFIATIRLIAEHFTDTKGDEFIVESHLITDVTRCPSDEDYVYIHLADGTQITAIRSSLHKLTIIREASQ
ncbi:hypothetical protein J4872_002635 [Escherichia coli]|uniref:hypothetical protein n=2 Tax=Escherichia coli TaxID=562 RepID=UPI000DA59670|nr:hypothetical protein [Escherichia coli]EEW2300065.1 hypothetical protein [Escherichia coli]EFH9514500.1 hypothetical protein [Escherichia coli]EFI2446323.1 hypothetical protein [Escherichia coli]EFJ3028632.1 hypothetical protein [Escherichia coli]EFJ3179208.1 hypothetical protein [Escherichia coli]